MSDSGSRKITNVNWNTYREMFPERYIKPSAFDTLIENTVSIRVRPQTVLYALDIGGGQKGTQGLRHEGVNAYLADPFMVESKPKWMKANLGPLRNIKSIFDLIVARGSFNYLTEEEIRLIPNFLKDSSSVFLFNTFSHPKTGERRYSSLFGDGIERSQIEGNKIRHQLLPDNSNIIFEHFFYVYSLDTIRNLLGPGKFECHKSGENSLYVQFSLS